MNHRQAAGILGGPVKRGARIIRRNPGPVQTEINFQPQPPPGEIRPAGYVAETRSGAYVGATAQHSHLRQEANRLVGCIAGQSGQDFRNIWVMAYHGLFKATGTHVIADAAREGRSGDQLGLAEERGLLPDLVGVLASMLTDPSHSPA